MHFQDQISVEGSVILRDLNKPETGEIIDSDPKAHDVVSRGPACSSQTVVELEVVCPVDRSRSSRKNCSGGTKNGLCWRMPPMMIIGWVRMMSTTVSPPNLARSYIHMTGSLYRGKR